MNVLLINEVCGHTSTGKICAQIAKNMEADGHTVRIAYGRSSYVPDEYKKYGVRIGSGWDVMFHVLQTRLFDAHGFGSKKATKNFLKWVERYNPDLIWLHNLHGYYINMEYLFRWIKSHPNIEVLWTLHDCWSFTGHCAYFSAVKCEKWKTSCKNCPQKKNYPASYFLDESASNYDKKRELFCGVNNLKLITPSKWLAQLVHQSFLREYPVEVRYNRIDENIFKPTQSNLRDTYGLNEKIIVLGVANKWEKRKGLEDFIKLTSMLDENYAIVLVGISKESVKRIASKIKIAICVEELSQNKRNKMSENKHFEDLKRCVGHHFVKYGSGIAIPEGVDNLYMAIVGEKKFESKVLRSAKLYCTPRTESAEELAKIYTMADIYVNATHEDNYPTTNLEAQACGTYVITYDVGGAAETIK